MRWRTEIGWYKGVGVYQAQPSLVCRSLHYGRDQSLLAFPHQGCLEIHRLLESLAQLALAMSAKAHHGTHASAFAYGER